MRINLLARTVNMLSKLQSSKQQFRPGVSIELPSQAIVGEVYYNVLKAKTFIYDGKTWMETYSDFVKLETNGICAYCGTSRDSSDFNCYNCGAPITRVDNGSR